MNFIPVGAEWVVEVGAATTYPLVGWLDNGPHLPLPVVAVPDKGIAELQHIIGRDPWTLRYAAEGDW